jgi:ADP-ribose pyrophosphatase YjhB (NUDIX family)
MRRGIETFCFVLVAVRSGRRLLLVREASHGQNWWLPAGRVEPGETFEDAAVRETAEEAGVQVRLDGLLRIERSLVEGGARLRVVFTAVQRDDAAPKAIADEHSLEARWFTADEIATLPLRGREPLAIARYLDDGGQVFPLSLLTVEQAAYDR